MDNEKRKRGRPPLSPEEKAESIAAQSKRKNEAHKRAGYAAQKKYRATHPEVYRGRTYEPKLRIPIDKKDELARLTARTGLTITELFVSAVEEKYGVILHKTLDKSDEE